jgi:hypothetical protein
MRVKVFNARGELTGPVESPRVVKSDASVHLAGALTAAGSLARAKLYPGIGHLGVLTSRRGGCAGASTMVGSN